LIVDAKYQPALIAPALDPVTAAPLDLSHSLLRSASPIHIEYLRNMGVSASISVSLLTDGVLAGLIARHHDSGPRLTAMPSWPVSPTESCEGWPQLLAGDAVQCQIGPDSQYGAIRPARPA
jgi:light-regulated signal transduction histidine kinase (bacteriophytochrome)